MDTAKSSKELRVNNRRPITLRLFIYSAGTLLLMTGVAKLISSHGTARILQNQDPILKMSFQRLFQIVGSIELAVASFCYFGRRLQLQTALVGWLATGFLIYRMGLNWVGYDKPCGCLGNLTDALRITPQTADTMMKITLAYLLIGSYGALFWLWRQNRVHRNSDTAIGITASSA